MSASRDSEDTEIEIVLPFESKRRAVGESVPAPARASHAAAAPRERDADSRLPRRSESTPCAESGERSDGDAADVVYTDGSCPDNGKRGTADAAGIGIWWGEGHPDNRGLPFPHAAPYTNQRAELGAAMYALEQHKGRLAQGRRIVIYTDSMYTIDCLTKYIAGWTRRCRDVDRDEWRKADGAPVVNQDLLKPLWKLWRAYPRGAASIRHVRGHRGHSGNTQADALATAGARAMRAAQSKRAQK